jgi:hypothetical protein
MDEITPQEITPREIQNMIARSGFYGNEASARFAAGA